MASKTRENKVFALLISLCISLLIGGIIFSLCGYSPVSAYAAIFAGGLGSGSAVINSLSQAMPIAFMGLAYIISMRAGLCNIGLEGQMYVGALAAVLAGVYIPGIPAVLHIPLILIVAIAASGLYGSLIAVLKIRFGANEIITAIMLNFIMEYFTSYLVNGPLKVEGTVAQSDRVRDSAILPNLVDTPQLSSGVLIFIALTFLIYFVVKYTKFGFEIRVTGENPLAAETGGIYADRIMTGAMFISGAIAGLAGAVMIIGVNGRFIDGFSSGYGWDGIAVASLAGLNIIGNIFSALLFGVLKAGAMVVSRTASIPYDFIVVIQAVIVLLLGCPRLSGELQDGLRKLFVRKEKKE